MALRLAIHATIRPRLLGPLAPFPGGFRGPCMLGHAGAQRRATRLSAGALLGRLIHALVEEPLELSADLRGLALEFAQKPAFFVVNRAVGEYHPPQPGGLLGVDPAARQDVVL